MIYISIKVKKGNKTKEFFSNRIFLSFSQSRKLKKFLHALKWNNKIHVFTWIFTYLQCVSYIVTKFAGVYQIKRVSDLDPQYFERDTDQDFG